MVSGRLNAADVPGLLRYVSIVAGVLALLLSVGFGLNLPWATAIWPWPDGRLSYLFIGSVLAAMAIDFIWVGLSGEWGALAAGAVTAFIMAAGMAVYLFQLSGQPGRPNFTMLAVWLTVVALSSVGVFFWSRRFAIRDRRPMPTLLKVSYAIFAVALLLAAVALILQAPTIFPWPLNPDSSVLFGWVFMGDAAYFLYALLNPRWHNARAQLLSFLVYDLFLILPFLQLFPTINPDRLLSLVIYLAVIIYSGALAVYYLFINPRTSRWAVAESPGSTTHESDLGALPE
ncbi:MAG: hypothetical protein ABI670_20010 [Chloroflexota bacterium]